MIQIYDNPKIPYYTRLEFPSVPEDIIQECLDSLGNTKPFYNMRYGDADFPCGPDDIRDQSYPETHLGFNSTWEIHEYAKGRNGSFAHFNLHNMPARCDEWLRSNIGPLINNKYKITVTELVNVKNGTTIYPHTDVPFAVINFMVSLGGNDVRTVFYKRKPEHEGTTTYQANVYPYEKIDVIEEHVIPNRSWAMLNVRELHSVENLNPLQRRVIIQMSIDEI